MKVNEYDHWRFNMQWMQDRHSWKCVQRQLNCWAFITQTPLHTIRIWHEHSTIPGHEYIVVTVKAFSNSAVYKHDSELKDHQSFSNIQSHIELAPVNLAICSSSVEYQAALIRDWIENIRETSDQANNSSRHYDQWGIAFSLWWQASGSIWAWYTDRRQLPMWLLWMWVSSHVLPQLQVEILNRPQGACTNRYTTVSLCWTFICI